MGLAYSSKCSLLYSYFYSLTPLFSFSFPHVFAPRVSLISPGHIASGILHCPFHPNISHSEFFIAHSIRMSHIRNSSPPSFHPDISHPEFFPADIPPGHLTSGILPRRHSTRTSHIRNSSPSTFHLDISHPEFFSASITLGYLTSAILSGQHSTFSGCLTAAILPGQHSTLSGCLTSRSEGQFLSTSWP